ncbi:MAG: 6-phosphogluconolactonase [Bacteroidota bacterium]|nr:6-phosphogluconolactonase [Bacteroidota bacterium]
MKVEIYNSTDELAEGMAVWICALVQATLQKQEFFTLVLSGGETPKSLFKKLASEKYIDKINWERLHIFWGDERAVPSTDERNNAKMAMDYLLDAVDIPAAQIHKMRVDIEPIFSAKEYEKILHTYFDNTQQSFDLVLLGIGEDGHTLSVFPGSALIDKHDNWVESIYNEKQQMYRITLTPDIVNKASHIAFMANGENKSSTLQRIIEGSFEPDVLPAQTIKPVNGELYWFLDKDAAKDLKNK